MGWLTVQQKRRATMHSKERMEQLIQAGVVREVAVVTKAFEVVTAGAEVGAEGNILHICQECGKAFDHYVIMTDGTTVCKYCQGSHKKNALILRLSESAKKALDSLGVGEIIRTSVDELVQKLIEAFKGEVAKL